MDTCSSYHRSLEREYVLISRPLHRQIHIVVSYYTLIPKKSTRIKIQSAGPQVFLIDVFPYYCGHMDAENLKRQPLEGGSENIPDCRDLSCSAKLMCVLFKSF